jgi:hypothetical protein
MAGHQVAILIDVSPSAMANKQYVERAERLLESVNRPNTMKASVYLVTDKVVHILPETQTDITGYTDGAEFDPYSEKVLNALAMYEHHSIMIFTPKPGKKKSLPKKTIAQDMIKKVVAQAEPTIYQKSIIEKMSDNSIETNITPVTTADWQTAFVKWHKDNKPVSKILAEAYDVH